MNPFAREIIGSPSRPESKLVLFDIDGTLITSGGAGESALLLALRDFFGREDSLEGIEIAGRTDTSIARQLCARYGTEATSENIHGFLAFYLRHLSEQLPLKKGRLLPGVARLLQAMRGDSGFSLGLLTGNLEAGATIKLSFYGIWHFFPFGAFADDSHLRNDLGPFALRRAADHHGMKFAPEQTFVLGDTPHDIACARAFGARAVAVTTGGFSSEQLAEHTPDHLFEDFENTDVVLAALSE